MRVAEQAVALTSGAEVQTTIDPDLPTVSVDLTKLSRAIANLLDNAVKFSDGNKTVELELERADEELQVRVLDRGRGVAEADRTRIFAPFEQGGDELTEKPEGLGVGLYEASCIARLHGGRISYDDRPGGGSCFTLHLPVSEVGEEAACAS